MVIVGCFEEGVESGVLLCGTGLFLVTGVSGRMARCVGLAMQTGVGIRVSPLVVSCVAGDVDGGGGANSNGDSRGGGSVDGVPSGVLGDVCGTVSVVPNPSGRGVSSLCR